MTTMSCPECNGTGSMSAIVGDEQGAERCPSCGGTGFVKVTEPQALDENDVMGDEAGVLHQEAA